MRKITLCFAVVATLCLLQTQALAKNGQCGGYITPKVVYSYIDMNKQKGSADWSESLGFGSDSDNVFGGALAVGYNFAPRHSIPVRAELEYALFSEAKGKGSHAEYDMGTLDVYGLKQKHQIHTLFVNAYYDITNETVFTPYIGAGVGMAFVRTKAEANFNDYGTGDDWSLSGSSSRKTNTNFAWNIGAGVSWELNQQVSLDLGYRFAGLGKVKSNSATLHAPDGQQADIKAETKNLYMHQVALGVRFSF